MGGCWANTMPIDINITLKDAIRSLGLSLDFTPKDVSAKSLNAAGAMALLYYFFKTDIIKLVGWWFSDDMFQYLHMQADPLMRNFIKLMV